MPSGSTGFTELQLGQNVVSFTGTTAPATGYHQAGEISYVNPPTTGFPFYFVCITTGTPGAWSPGPIAQTSGATTVGVASVLPTGASFINFSPGGYAATMSSAVSTASGTRLNMFASAAVTLSPLSGESIVGSTTLAAGSVSEFIDQGTIWYRIV